MAKAAEKTQETEEPVTGLALLRKPFEPHQISKLPKPTKRQTDEVKTDFRKGTRCEVCGGWHHPDVVHLDYVGHAALTDRLLECDPEWNWEPASFDESGAPSLDANGGMWIRLTVCGVTRMGYGHPDGKRGGDAIKETIGDALRNAAMRFGAALDLWHKGVLHNDAEDDGAAPRSEAKPKQDNASKNEQARALYATHENAIRKAKTLDELKKAWTAFNGDKQHIPVDWQRDLLNEKNARKEAIDAALADDQGDDAFPGDLPTTAPDFDNLEPDEHGYTEADYMRAG